MCVCERGTGQKQLTHPSPTPHPFPLPFPTSPHSLPPSLPPPSSFPPSFSVPLLSRYRDGITERDQLVQWLWQTLDLFTNEEKILFLRFVSGRSRLPTRVSEIPQRFQVMKGQVRPISRVCGDSDSHGRTCLVANIQTSRVFVDSDSHGRTCLVANMCRLPCLMLQVISTGLVNGCTVWTSFSISFSYIGRTWEHH